MLFNSLSFLIFFPAVFFAYWALPARLRPVLLLLASCYFYMAFVPQYVLILFYLIVLDYSMARLIESATGSRRKLFFGISLFSTIGTLFVFKYFNFFNDNAAALASFLGWHYPLGALSLILPLGLSFHTFQSLAYVIEVYKGRYQAEKNLLTYSLYVMFFPQLVAGPIERPAHLLPQLKAAQTFDYARVVSGLELMLWGFFKKLAVAGPLGVLVDFVYKNPGSADGSVLLIAAVAFYFQLYADFSGYTDIALGSARMLGITLIENFNQPYLSRTTAELWRRWHISLSSWFRDYVYFPIAWRRGGHNIWIYAAILTTFALMGVWHGAGWNFLIMGALFGSYICIGMILKPWRDMAADAVGLNAVPRIRMLLQILTTFIFTVFAWIFFRTQTVGEALAVLEGIATRWGAGAFSYLTCSDYCAFYQLGIGRKELLVVVLAVVGMMVYETAARRVPLPWALAHRTPRWAIFYGIIFWILCFGYLVPQTFIYFQF